MPKEMLDGAIMPVDSDGNIVALLDWENHEAIRRDIFDKVKTAMLKLFAEKEHNGVRLSISDIDYEDPEYRSIAEQKKILHEDGFFSRRLRGTVTLTDTATGSQLDQKRITLMHVPVWSNRGTFVREGNEWGTINQTRLIPGAYSRWQNNGDLETQFNVRPGTGGSMRVIFEPEKAIYKFKTAGQEFHLYSLLHDIGVDDQTMKDSWGEDIFQKNKETYDARTFDKAYNKLVPEWDRKLHPSRDLEDKKTLISNALNRALIATAVVKSTLPNLFDRQKAASWRIGGETMSKIANLNTDQLVDIATYINHAANKNINIDSGKDILEKQIINTVTTGNPSGVPDQQDDAAQVVLQIQQMRMLNGLNKKINEVQQGYVYKGR